MKNIQAIIVTAGFALATATVGAAERPHLVQPDDLSKLWLVSSTGDPMSPGSGVNLMAASCATVSYEIERNGSTSHIKLEKVATQGDLGQVAISIITNLHYTATPANISKDPVYTYVTLPFNLPSPATGPSANAKREAVLAQCKLEGFTLPDSMR